ncbi:hypothetical protein AMAG_03175 [Allomyces macrogynus ATCC 38327]|uniref:CSD domain-containing protein n=1 Tax=Allomyces macrogynus (strain ATCC 38327) TaxID=578462 RepID=A0A0L0S532_ALLM3|nr:hypothetical protein AMAG_03175 [Allomyces macrogynus ATCC 38327]|eukprot:KNE57464.1 hypothetical protein AMAG_03175 [Allomyces macrogynus ATCC 38327]
MASDPPTTPPARLPPSPAPSAPTTPSPGRVGSNKPAGAPRRPYPHQQHQQSWPGYARVPPANKWNRRATNMPNMLPATPCAMPHASHMPPIISSAPRPASVRGPRRPSWPVQLNARYGPRTGEAVAAERKRGHVKFFNSDKGYGFIIMADPVEIGEQEIFVHHTVITASEQAFRSLGEGEEVEFRLCRGEKGYFAQDVTGPGGRCVQGDPHAVPPYVRAKFMMGNGAGSPHSDTSAQSPTYAEAPLSPNSTQPSPTHPADSTLATAPQSWYWYGCDPTSTPPPPPTATGGYPFMMAPAPYHAAAFMVPACTNTSPINPDQETAETDASAYPAAAVPMYMAARHAGYLPPPAPGAAPYPTVMYATSTGAFVPVPMYAVPPPPWAYMPPHHVRRDSEDTVTSSVASTVVVAGTPPPMMPVADMSVALPLPPHKDAAAVDALVAGVEGMVVACE